MKNILLKVLFTGFLVFMSLSTNAKAYEKSTDINSSSYEELKYQKAEALNTKTGEKFYVGGVSTWVPIANKEKAVSNAKLFALGLCDESFNPKSLKRKYSEALRTLTVRDSHCRISRINDLTIHKDLSDYNSKSISQTIELNTEQEEIIESVVHRYLNICSYPGSCQDTSSTMAILVISQAFEAVVSEFYLSVGKEDRDLYFTKVKTELAARWVESEAQQRELILTALVDRCSNFGWRTEDNIASCVKQEAFRDLQIQEQDYKLQVLEQQITNATAVKDKPFFFEALNILIDQAERKDNQQIRRDIMNLKGETRSLNSQKRTQTALNALYGKK